MKQELKELISHLERLDHLDMDKMDDAQLADILWLSIQTTEGKKAKKEKSKQAFLEWLKKWWDLLLSLKPTKEKERKEKKETQDEKDEFHDEEAIPLIPKRLKDNSNLSIKIPQKKDFFVTNELLKALEVFKVQHESSEKSMELDEESTVEYFSETKILEPKFYAQTENHYDLYLLIDISDSMYIWQESIELFVKKLEIFSIFRNIKFLYLDSSEKEAKIYNNKAKSSKASKLLNLEGRFVLFVLTDCIAPAWSKGNMLENIYEYQKKMPTSIINMLPRRMWKGTVLRQTNITRLKRNSKVLSSDIDSMLLSFDEEYFKQDILRVPVVNFMVDDLKSMSQFMTGKLKSSCKGIVASKSEILNVNESEKKVKLTAQQRVQEFFNYSSSTAHKLALYLSVSTHLNFPIMKMIQHNMLPNSTQLDFSEFFVGGLLDKSKKDEFYMFHAGVRELLQDKLSPYKAAEILERNSKFIAKNFGSSLDFSTMLMSESENDKWTEADKRFADMSLSTLERLGGNYSKEAKRIRRERFGINEKKEESKLTLITPPTKRYQMGSKKEDKDAQDREKPVHEVIINYDFEISPTQVTVGEFKVFVEETNYVTEAEKGDGAYVYDGKDWNQKKDASWKNPYFEQTDEHPVVCVSWNDTQAYIKWLNEKIDEVYRLPTEAEWEFACRAGSTTKWHFGEDEKELKGYAWYSENSDKKTHPVGTKKENQWGLYDMHGNVLEWCLDDFEDTYNNTPRDGTEHIVEKKEYKSLRGGSWNFNAGNTRSAYRSRYNPNANDLRNLMLKYSEAKAVDSLYAI